MSTVTTTFSAVGVSNGLTVLPQLPTQPGPNSFVLTIAGTFVATLILESSQDTVNWTPQQAFTDTQDLVIPGTGIGQPALTWRLRCSAYTSGSAVCTLEDSDNVLVEVPNLNGTVVYRLRNSGAVDGVTALSGLSTIATDGAEYAGTGHSFQPISADLPLAAAAGSGDGTDPKFLAPIMGNIIGDDLTADANYLGGLIGFFSITGVKATTYPSGAVLGGIADDVTDADGAFVAFIDGDGDVTKANAAFKAMSNNSTAGSGFNYGLDLHGPAHDGYNALAILKADVRMSNEVCILNGAGAPTDGVTGATFAEIGSLYVDITNGKLYINSGTGTKTSPVWKIVTSA